MRLPGTADRFRPHEPLPLQPVRDLWRQHLSGRVNAQYQIWGVLMLNAWIDAYAAELSGAAPAPQPVAA